MIATCRLCGGNCSLQGFLIRNGLTSVAMGIKTCPKCDRARCAGCGAPDITGKALVCPCGRRIPHFTTLDLQRLRFDLDSEEDA